MSYPVAKSKDGREILIMEDDGFVASYINGRWENRLLFNACQMNEDLIPVRNKKEERKLLDEAHRALRKSQYA
jgi:hypothetical protein